MRATIIFWVLGLVVLVFAGSQVLAYAQTAQDRAGELKTWREQCSDPDIDLRTAYVEAAIASDDVAVARVCIRQSLESTNADMRNLGLRAALVAADRLLFTVAPTQTLAKALADAEGDDRKLAALEKTYEMRHWRLLQTGLVIEVDDADLLSGSSRWYPLVGLSDRRDNYAGEASVIGDTVNWVGKASLSLPNDCIMNLALSEGANLAGTFKCGNLAPFPVSARLM